MVAKSNDARTDNARTDDATTADVDDGAGDIDDVPIQTPYMKIKPYVFHFTTVLTIL